MKFIFATVFYSGDTIGLKLNVRYVRGLLPVKNAVKNLIKIIDIYAKKNYYLLIPIRVAQGERKALRNPNYIYRLERGCIIEK